MRRKKEINQQTKTKPYKTKKKEGNSMLNSRWPTQNKLHGVLEGILYQKTLPFASFFPSFYLSSFLSSSTYRSFWIWNERERKKGCGIGYEGSGNNLGDVCVWETVNRIYCMKNTFFCSLFLFLFGWLVLVF